MMNDILNILPHVLLTLILAAVLAVLSKWIWILASVGLGSLPMSEQWAFRLACIVLLAMAFASEVFLMGHSNNAWLNILSIILYLILLFGLVKTQFLVYLKRVKSD